VSFSWSYLRLPSEAGKFLSPSATLTTYPARLSNKPIRAAGTSGRLHLQRRRSSGIRAARQREMGVRKIQCPAAADADRTGERAPGAAHPTQAQLFVRNDPKQRKHSNADDNGSHGVTRSASRRCGVTYDSLNRIKTAAETIGGRSRNNPFVYDRFGNRAFGEAGTTTSPNYGFKGPIIVCVSRFDLFIFAVVDKCHAGRILCRIAREIVSIVIYCPAPHKIKN
jgi:hypothetical protein